jgi:CRISPR system Cascade subunit CasC
MGGVDRLRVSSQSLKRAWRTSKIFERWVSNGTKMNEGFEKEHPKHIGFRSKIFANKWVSKFLRGQKIDSETAELWSEDFSRAFGQVESEENKLSQLAHISDLEAQGFYYAALNLVDFLRGEKENETFAKVREMQENRKRKKRQMK